jgi:hypothetical protein
MLIIYIIIIIFYSIKTFNKITYTLTEKINVKEIVNKEERIKTSLFWEWNYNEVDGSLMVYIIFLLTLTMLSYENLSYPTNIVLSFISVFTFGLSFYLFKGRALGRFWCNFASFVPLFILFINT